MSVYLTLKKNMMKKTLNFSSVTSRRYHTNRRSLLPSLSPLRLNQIAIESKKYLDLRNALRRGGYGENDIRSISSSIDIARIQYNKISDPKTWFINWQELNNLDSVINNIPVSKGDKYIFIVKVVLLNKDLKWGGKIGHTHLMCGTQSLLDYENEASLQDFISEVIDKVSITLDEYNFESKLEYVQVTFWPLGLSISKEKSSVINNTPSVYNEQYGTDFNIPIATDSSILGNPLKVEYNDQGIVSHIITKINDQNVNFIDQVYYNLSHVNKNACIGKFDHNWNFYDVLYKNKTYLLAIHSYGDFVKKKVLFTNKGSILSIVTDHFDKNGEFLTRISGNKIIQGDKNSIYSISRKLKLAPIPNKRTKHDITQFVPNRNIGSLDCETFKDFDNVNKVFAIGFKPDLDKDTRLYHINDFSGDSNLMVIKFMDDIMSPKYNNISFYCHNWGGYDSIFLVKILNDFNLNVRDKYKMSYHFRDNRMYKLIVQDREDKNRKVTICDSYTILNSSLSELCKSFDLKEEKSFFPYSFVSRDTLSYLGVTPSMDYYNNISIENYNDLLSSNWSLYQESLKYLKNDIDILCKIIHKANNQLFNDYNVNLRDKGTIAGLATKIFMKDHYKNNIPLINKSTLYNDVKEGYYGGITEVYKPYGENLYYYDVNSLYPSVCLNPMPGVNNSTRIEYIDVKPALGSLFGFFYCDIETPQNLYLGVLPVRSKDGLIFPLGKFSGWYFSEELKFAESLGYKITVHKGYSFEKEFDVFKSYVNKIYSIKNNPINKTQKSIAKGLLNNLLGRFGISLYKPTTKIVDISTYENILSSNRIVDHRVINDKYMLITYYDIIDPVLVEHAGLDINDILGNKHTESTQHTTTSIVISAAVTAYARIAISKIKLDILKLNGEIYYSDTDSIVTNIELPNNLVSKTELGKLKLEHVIKKGIFISGKTYCFIDSNDNFISKAKGVSSTSLKWEHFEEMLDNNPVLGLKKISKVDWTKGEVNISTETIILNGDVYKKRVKLFDSYNIWDNTKPIVLNTDSALNKPPASFNIKNIFNNVPITTKRLFSTMKSLPEKNTSLKSKILSLFTKVKYNYKEFFINIFIVILISILYTLYIACKFDEELEYEANTYQDLDIEYDTSRYDDTEINMEILVDNVLDIKETHTIKGHGLLDDSLYNNDYESPSIPIEDTKIEFNNNESSDSDHYIEMIDNTLNCETSGKNPLHILVEPSNSDDFKSDTFYVHYKLSEDDKGKNLPNNIFVEVKESQPAFNLDLYFKEDDLSNPICITQYTYHDLPLPSSNDPLDVHLRENGQYRLTPQISYDEVTVISKNDASHISGLSRPNNHNIGDGYSTDDNDTIVSILRKYE